MIPARGGSKGLPRKNLANFLGRPLIAWSIAAAHHSRAVTRVIVSTDDPEIAAVSEGLGADVPFQRPTDLAGDEVRDLPVFQHALEFLAVDEGYHPHLVVQLRPTAPIRPDGLIDKGVGLLLDSDADSLRAVSEPLSNPYKTWRIAEDRLVPLLQADLPEPWNAPRQELPATWWQVGTLDVIRTQTILDGSMSGEHIRPLVIDSTIAADIDDERSLAVAESAGRRAGLEDWA